MLSQGAVEPEASPERRFFISISIPSPGGGFRALKHIGEDRKRVRAIFDELKFEPYHVVEDPSAELLVATLRTWLTGKALTRRDAVVVYYSGHGYASGQRHYLCTKGFRTEALADALPTSEIVRLFLGREDRPGRFWLILDCCHSGQALGHDVGEHVFGNETGCYLLAASGSGSPAFDGAFSRALVEAVRNPLARASLGRLSEAINEQIVKSGGPPQLSATAEKTPPSFDMLDALAGDGPTVDVVPTGGRDGKGARTTKSPRPIGTVTSALLVPVAVVVIGILPVLAVRHWRRPVIAAPAVAPATTSIRPAPPPVMVPIAGGMAVRGTDAKAARRMYTDCGLERGSNCGPSFQTSIFARQVGAGVAPVNAFLLDAREVTVAEVAGWLDRNRAQLQIGEWGSAGAPVLDQAGERLAAVSIEARPDPRYAVTLAGARYVAVGERVSEPATFVSWYGAARFCQDAGKRLPTDAEWELAARGGRGRAYPWGDGAPRSAEVTFAPAPGERPVRPQAVGTSPGDRTPEGVWDLGGNVAEWTDTDFQPVTDQDREQCRIAGCRIVRGGSFNESALWLHPAILSRFSEVAVADNIGFRCASPRQ